MEIKGAIFDLDGTLIDSMGACYTVGSDYMRALGLAPPRGLDDALLRLSIAEGAQYLSSIGVPGTAREIQAGVNRVLDDFYSRRARAKPGAGPLLKALRRDGVMICVATATDRPQVEAGLRCAGLREYINEIFTCTQLNTSKRERRIFDAACEYMGTPRASTWVFEDASHAARTAKDARYRVCGVYDPFEPDQAALAAAADVYVASLSDALAAIADA